MADCCNKAYPSHHPLHELRNYLLVYNMFKVHLNIADDLFACSQTIVDSCQAVLHLMNLSWMLLYVNNNSVSSAAILWLNTNHEEYISALLVNRLHAATLLWTLLSNSTALDDILMPSALCVALQVPSALPSCL